MNKQNKVYKLLRIVFLTLAIISMVFGLCKKVGLCASSENSTISSLPFPVGAGYGNNFTAAELTQILQVIEQDRVNSNDSDYLTIGIVIPGEIDSTYTRFRVFSQSDCITITDPEDAFTTGSIVSYKWGSSNYAGCREVILNTSDLSYYEGYWVTSYQPSFNTSTWLSELPNGNYSLSSGLLNGYPLYIFQDIYAGNTLFFSENPLNSGSGHSKGGIIAEMTENDEITSEELSQVDISAPADPSSNFGWFQKILNAIGKVNNSIQSGVLTISGYIQGFKNYISEPFDQEAFEDEFYSIPFVNDFTSLGDLIDDSGVFDWSDVTPAQRVAFTFDFGGSVLPHTSNEINFDWYTGTVKTTILALMSTFLVLGLLVTIINQIPNIISGKSGDKGGGSDS